MLFKIIPIRLTESRCNTVCVIVTEGSNKEIEVHILAWHLDKQSNPYLQKSSIVIPNFDTACCYVDDFSEQSAESFVRQFKFQE